MEQRLSSFTTLTKICDGAMTHGKDDCGINQCKVFLLRTGQRALKSSLIHIEGV
jgi:hypothetical protein